MARQSSSVTSVSRPSPEEVATIDPVAAELGRAVRAFNLDHIWRMAQTHGKREDLGPMSMWHHQLLIASIGKEDDQRLVEGLRVLDELIGKPAMDDLNLLNALFSRGDRASVEWGRGCGLTIARNTFFLWRDHTLGHLQGLKLTRETGWVVARNEADEFNSTLMAFSALRGDTLEELDALHEAIGTRATKAGIGKAVAQVLYHHAASDKPDLLRLTPSNEGCVWLSTFCSTRHIKQGANAIMMDDECQASLIDPLCKQIIPLGVAAHEASQLERSTPQVPSTRKSPRL